jgi:hypothetical protein
VSRSCLKKAAAIKTSISMTFLSADAVMVCLKGYGILQKGFSIMKEKCTVKLTPILPVYRLYSDSKSDMGVELMTINHAGKLFAMSH